jgi:hypothetical protein
VESELRFRWISGAVCLLLAHSAWAAGAIHLKNRTISSLDGGSERVGTHYMLQFRSYPDAGVRAELARRGIRVLGYVPDSTLMVASATTPDLGGLDVESVGSLALADKLSPQLVTSGRGAFLVMLHPDVTAAAGRGLIVRLGFVIIPRAGLLPGNFVVVGPSRNLAEMAAADEVSYIMPASPDLLSGAPLIACAGALTEAGVVSQYVEVSTGWPASPAGDVELNYTFETLTPSLDPNAIQSEITRALALWASYTNLKFSEGTDPQASRTIDIKFASGQHGDAYPFDGSTMLAHTFYPAPPNSEPIAGDMHLNSDENWQIGSGSGIDLFSVALHEAGHALGLGHTDNPDDVMYPYYRTLAGLSVDDIAGIRALYGSNDPTPAPQDPIDPSTPVTTTTVGATPAMPTATPPTTPTFTPPFTTSPTTPTATLPPTTPTAPSAPPTPTVPATPTTPTVAATPTAPTAVSPPAPAAPAANTNPTSPSLRITSPGSTILSTTAASVTVAGTAADNTGVTAVLWTTSTGGSGTASGTTNWSAQVPLLTGDNVVIVRAYDAAGNSAWRALTVVRR